MSPSATIIAQLRELQALTSARADMLEESRDQERTRAEAAEAELRELRKAMVDAVEIIDECRELLDDQADVRDSDSGPKPNAAMSICSMIDAWRKS